MWKRSSSGSKFAVFDNTFSLKNIRSKSNWAKCNEIYLLLFVGLTEYRYKYWKKVKWHVHWYEFLKNQRVGISSTRMTTVAWNWVWSCVLPDCDTWKCLIISVSKRKVSASEDFKMQQVSSSVSKTVGMWHDCFLQCQQTAQVLLFVATITIHWKFVFCVYLYSLAPLFTNSVRLNAIKQIEIWKTSSNFIPPFLWYFKLCKRNTQHFHYLFCFIFVIRR